MPGGVGGSVRRIAQLLSRNGLGVHVAVLKKVSHPIVVGDNISSIMDGDVHVHEISFSHGKIDKSTIKSVTTSESDFMVYQGNIESLLSLKLLHKRYQFNVLNGFFLTNVGLLTCLFGKMESIPVIASIRGNDIGKNIFLAEHLPVLQYVLKNADYVTSVSEDLLNAALTIHPFKRFKVINNSFEWGRIDENKSVAKPCKGLVIGTSGIFRFKKGLPLLLKALEHVKFKTEWSLLLVGDFLSKEEKSYHDYFFKRCSFKNQIHLTGLVDRNDVFSYLKHIDVFIAPSLFSEGCPTTVLEAMAMGRPIVGSDAGAIAEVLTHNETGLIYPQENHAALTDAIQKLVDDHQLRDTLGMNALSYMRGLNPQDEWRAWESVYLSCSDKSLP